MAELVRQTVSIRDILGNCMVVVGGIGDPRDTECFFYQAGGLIGHGMYDPGITPGEIARSLHSMAAEIEGRLTRGEIDEPNEMIVQQSLIAQLRIQERLITGTND